MSNIESIPASKPKKAAAPKSDPIRAALKSAKPDVDPALIVGGRTFPNKARADDARRAAKTAAPPKAKKRSAMEVGKIMHTAMLDGATPAEAAKKAKIGARAQIEADARAGKLPAQPDFSADTHTRFRPKLAEIAALVKAGNIKALEAFEIKGISTSPRAMMRYRDLSVLALKAKGGDEPI